MARTAATREPALLVTSPSETRAVLQALTRIRVTVHNLNRIANRMDRTLARRLRRLEGLRE